MQESSLGGSNRKARCEGDRGEGEIEQINEGRKRGSGGEGNYGGR